MASDICKKGWPSRSPRAGRPARTSSLCLLAWNTPGLSLLAEPTSLCAHARRDLAATQAGGKCHLGTLCPRAKEILFLSLEVDAMESRLKACAHMFSKVSTGTQRVFAGTKRSK